MKALLINDKLAVIEDSVYFPFTYTISDLDNINIINVPASKQITIPRCNQNDEIFGYIGEITRYNIGFSDNLSGVKFNQIKKCTYKLSIDSEIVSKGILEVVSATDKEYSIVLYDELLDALESYDKIYLNEVPLRELNKNLFDERCNVTTYHNFLTSGIRPVICTDEANTKGTELICNIQATEGGALTYGPSTIPFESSNVQLRSVATSDCRWAIRNQVMLYSINYAHIGPTINYNSLPSVVVNTYLLSNKPSNKYAIEDTNTLQAYSSGNLGQPNKGQTNWVYDIPVGYTENNGQMYCNIPITATYTKPGAGSPGNTVAQYYLDSVSTIKRISNTNVGDFLGSKYAYISLISYIDGVEYENEPLLYVVPLYFGVNAVFSAPVNGVYPTNSTVTLSFNLVVNGPMYTAPFTKVRIRLRDYALGADGGKIYTDQSHFFDYSPTLSIVNSASTLRFKNSKFVDGNHLNSLTLLPKISVKTYLLALAKTFNLKLEMIDGSINLSNISYKLVSDIPIIEDGGSLQLTTITDSKLALNTNKPDFKELEQYKIIYGDEYAQQTVNTGYRVRESIKAVRYDVSIPIELKDANPFAYDTFLKYLNNGYQKQSAGIVTGCDDKLTFCYVNTINDAMHIGSKYFPDTIENNAVVDKLWVTDENNLLNRWDKITTSTSQPWDSLYYTATPYTRSGNTITLSLDMNKPHVNYAGILDADYSDTTTLYHKYHKNMLIDKFNSDTHIVSCRMYLDINPLKMIFNIYNIKGSYYIISELPEYDPTQPGMYDVKLMKVNNPVNYTNPYN